MADRHYDVAIVGAGFTGSCLAVHLARVMPRGARILLLGTPKATGRGLAYGTENPDHLLNVRAGRMSLYADDMLHFTRWLVDGCHQSGMAPSTIAESYVPRQLYGRYIRDTLRRISASAGAPVRIDMVEATVAELQKDEGGFLLRTASGQRFVARAAALCNGNHQAPLPVPPEQVAGAARDHVIADPWSDVRLQGIATEASVLLVGTGLTMVDQVLTLLSRGHGGPITAVSRHGFLPQAHLPARSEPRTIPLPEGDTRLRRLLVAVIAAIRAETAAGADWRLIIDGLRPVTQEIWLGLDHGDRRRFLRHLDALWSVHRHRMAPPVARRIEALRASGGLTVRAGRILAIKKSSQGVMVGFRARGEQTVALLPFDWVINCTGVRAAVADPLIGRLINLGHARLDPLKRGLDITGPGQVLGRTGAATPGLFALGPLSAGCLLEITAVPDIRDQCAALAGTIAERASDRVEPITKAGRGVARSGARP